MSEIALSNGLEVVRKYRDGRLRAFSYASENWRDVMPEGPFPPVVEINSDPEFSAREISKSEFEAVWGPATRSARRDIGRQIVVPPGKIDT